MKKGWVTWICMVGLLLAVVPSNSARAEVEIQKLPEVLDAFLIGGDLSLFWRWDHYPYFAKNSFVQKDNNWGEIFGRVRFKAKKSFGWADAEMQIAPIFLATIDQDVYGLLSDKTEVDFNQAYIQFGKLFNSPFTVTVGMQDIYIEKQFMIGLGKTQETALWLLFDQSFPFAARVDGDFGAFKPTVFWARSGDYFAQTFEGKDEIEVAGVNLHYDIMEGAYVYGGFFTKMDDTPPGTTGDVLGQTLAQTDTHVVDIGGDWTFGPVNIEAEAVYQFGNVEFVAGDSLDRKSFGFFVSPKFTFPVAYSPYIKLHYIYWPGDEDFADDDIEEYDPMFEGWTVWNRWFIGEHMTEVFGLKTNTIKYIAEVGFYPVETCQIQAMYIRHQLDEKYFPLGVLNPVPVSSKDFADEFNLFMNWQATDFLFVHSGLGFDVPNDGAQEILGNKTAVFAQLWLMFAF